MRDAIDLPNFGDYGDPWLLGDLAEEAEDHGQRIFAWHDFTRNILRVISARPTSYLLPERDRPTRVL
jgi:hypothetical protein